MEYCILNDSKLCHLIYGIPFLFTGVSTMTTSEFTELMRELTTLKEAVTKGKEEHYKGEAMPFLSTIQDWIKTKHDTGIIQDNTYDKYRSQMNKLIEFFKEDKSIMLSDVTEEQLNALLVYLRGKWKSTKTIRDTFGSILRPFFRDQAERGNIKLNPCERIQLPPEIPSNRTAYSDEEIRAIMSTLNPDYFLTIAIWIIYYTGMRRSELLALTWDDIDFNNRLIHIHKTNKKGTICDRTKTKNSKRYVPIPDGLLEKLKYHRHHIQKNARQYVVSQLKSDKPLKPDYLTKHFKNTLKKLGITERYKNLHTFRRTIVTNMRRAGMSTEDIQAQTGHKDSRMICYYTDDLKYQQARCARMATFSNNMDKAIGI